MGEMSILTTDTPELDANDLVHAKEMAEALHQAYPGHLWAVNVDGKNGVADIRNLSLSGRYAFRLILPEMFSISDFKKKVIRGGGEMLERYRLARGRADEAAIADMPMTRTGLVLGDFAK